MGLWDGEVISGLLQHTSWQKAAWAAAYFWLAEIEDTFYTLAKSSVRDFAIFESVK